MKINSQEFQNKELKTPVLFLIFNRPDTTKQVFEAIRQAKTPRLYVAADGPREGKLGEVERVEEARTIATAVDWPCEVKTLFRDKNLGCKYAVSSAITWFFEQEEQGIILEDDCLPHLDFFSFCEILLDHYYSDKRISVITGNNFQNGIPRGDATYYFSKYAHCWGWATWRKTWNYYDGSISFWPQWKDSNDFNNKFPDKAEKKYWKKIFNLSYKKKIDSWGYPFIACMMKQNSLTVVPNSNLISNIGFGDEATHTKDLKNKLSNLPTKKLEKIITHPKNIEVDIEADAYDFNLNIGDKKLGFFQYFISISLRITKFIFKKINFYKN
jgi:hypothetical protein